MKVGFTGSRKGIDSYQRTMVKKKLSELAAAELHHGDCIGADKLAHHIAKELELKVIIHPPTNPKLRAFCKISHGDEIRDAFIYLTRNRNIVDETEFLIACPNSPESLRSGTWATIRYAQSQRKQIVIFLPNGEN